MGTPSIFRMDSADLWMQNDAKRPEKPSGRGNPMSKGSDHQTFQVPSKWRNPHLYKLYGYS